MFKKMIFFSGMLVLTACSETRQSEPAPDPQKQALQKEIAGAEQDLKASGDLLDVPAARGLIGKYIEYSNQYHFDTLAGEYMLRAASLSAGTGNYGQAVDLLINYYDGFNVGDRHPEAAFTVAFIYDEYLRNPELAAKYYQSVIDNHPESDYAGQAKAALRLVGMSDEELLKFLDSQNP